METASFVVSLVGLALSILNSIVLVWLRFVRLKLSRVFCIEITPRGVFIDCVITNKSALPLSINAADILIPGKRRCPNDPISRFTLSNGLSVGSSVRSERFVQPATKLPADVPAYTASRIVLQFSHHKRLYRFLQHLHSRRSPRLSLYVRTSRGCRVLSARVRFLDWKDWSNDFR